MILEEPAKRPLGHRALRSAVGVWTSAVAFAGPLLIYLLWIHPLRSAEIQATEQRSTELREECRAVEEFDTDFLGQVKYLGLELAKLESILPNHPPSTQVPDILRRLAAAHGVLQVRLEPEEPVVAGRVGVLPWRAELEGRLGGLTAFIQYFEQADLILKVTKLHLVRLGDDSYQLRLHFDSFYAAGPEP